VARAWKLRDNIGAYDAMYIALGEGLEAPVVTCDGPLASAPQPTLNPCSLGTAQAVVL